MSPSGEITVNHQDIFHHQGSKIVDVDIVVHTKQEYGKGMVKLPNNSK